jgi:transposase
LAGLYRKIGRLRRNLEDAERVRERLRREHERLKKELDAARRAGTRQAAPFSKGAPVVRQRRPSRRRGRHHGRHAHRCRPATIDETLNARLPAQCPACGGGVSETHIADQIQEDLPVARPQVRRFRVHIGRCRQYARRVQGRHPLQTSDGTRCRIAYRASRPRTGLSVAAQ